MRSGRAAASPARRKDTAMRTKTTRYKGISRVDVPAGQRTRTGQRRREYHGYYGRVPYAGVVYSRSFSDSLYGDRLGALAAALEWVEQKERELGKPHTLRHVYTRPPRAKRPENDTGVVGVRRIQKGSADRFEASWMKADGAVGRTSYSIRKHGEKKAFRLAKQARMRGERRRLICRFDHAAVMQRRARLAARAPAHPQLLELLANYTGDTS
jgi:hypothetical protein